VSVTSSEHLATFAQVFPILDRGRSKDRKYRVTENNGNMLYLRVHDIKYHDDKAKTFNFAKQAFANGASIMQPLDMGIYDDEKEGYTLWEWVQGVVSSLVFRRNFDLETAMMGSKLGCILKKLHVVPCLDATCVDYYQKELIALKKQASFLKNQLNILFNYFERHKNVFAGRPLLYIHGDLNRGNILVTERGLVLVDFDAVHIGDPWEEFSEDSWVALDDSALALVIAAIHAYNPPPEFWILHPFYCAIKLMKRIIIYKKRGKEVAPIVARLDAYCNLMSASEAPTAPAWFVSEDKLFFDIMQENGSVNIFVHDLSRIKLLPPLMALLAGVKRLIKRIFN